MDHIDELLVSPDGSELESRRVRIEETMKNRIAERGRRFGRNATAMVKTARLRVAVARRDLADSLDSGKLRAEVAIVRGRESVGRQMRARAPMWAGVAAGLGFAAGLAGRFARRRARLRVLPQVLVVEAC